MTQKYLKSRISAYKNQGFAIYMRHIQESPPQFENQIMAQVYIRSITRSTMYQKAPFC